MIIYITFRPVFPFSSFQEYGYILINEIFKLEENIVSLDKKNFNHKSYNFNKDLK